MNVLPYTSMPETPVDFTGTNALARLVDGIGFRYRWATEGMTQNQFEFRPVEGSMDMKELLEHIYSLAFSAHKVFVGTLESKSDASSLEELRLETLKMYAALSAELKAMDDVVLLEREANTTRKVSFWYWINGPLADALTHVGQIVSWRRIAGNPQPEGVNVFFGTKK